MRLHAAMCVALLAASPAAPVMEAPSSQSQRPRTTATPPARQPGVAVVRTSEVAGADLGARINAADRLLGARAGEILATPARGEAGKLNTQVTISSGHTLRFAPGLYESDFQDAGADGIIRLKDGSRLVGSGWDTILRESSRPTHGAARNHWTVVAAYGASVDNDAATRGVSISDLKIEGAAPEFWSAASTINLGNCRDCSVERVWLDGTRTIGIQAGGGSLAGNSAQGVRVRDNLMTHVASQALACTNCVDVEFARNRIVSPGARSTAGTPPGNVPIDLEPNAPTDRMRNVRITDNLIDASESIYYFSSPITLHGIAVQNTVGVPPAEYSVEVSNNRIVGAAITSPAPRIAASGVWVNGAPNTVVRGNYIQRTYDGLRVTSAANFELSDNTLVSVGFTANLAIIIEGTNVSGRVRGNVLRVDPRSPTAAGEDATITEKATSGAGVVYERNTASDGVHLSLRTSRVVN